MRALLLVLALVPAASALAADDASRLDALVAAYPDALAGRDGSTLVWRDGARMPADDGEPGKTDEAAIQRGSILDMLREPYPRPGELDTPPRGDPGRVRNRAFFDKLYGDCTRGEVAGHLVPVVWLPHSWGHVVMVTALHGVAEHLDAVSRELDALPEADTRVLYPPAGAYVCRTVRATGQPSMHARGAAIDINARLSDFWGWQTGEPRYRNRVPAAIVDVFERHGFIWGGRWRHYDTMHFEYRPELLPPAAKPRIG